MTVISKDRFFNFVDNDCMEKVQIQKLIFEKNGDLENVKLYFNR